jgi:methylmalonyl-CoA/ethylmalonyl-CoA epimerase
MNFDHIGIFVKDLKEGRNYFYQFFDIVNKSKEFHDHEMGVSVQFLYDKCGVRYEIVCPLGINNPVDGMLIAKKNILNHMAYRVEEFDNKCLELRENGCIPISNTNSAVAFNGARVIFFLTPLGFVIEIIEDSK